MAKPNVIRKADLITYAKDCLVEKGIEKFTLRAVAEKAGITQGTVYYHFRTKEQLLLDIVEDICKDSWHEISLSNEFINRQALESAKSRCTHDSFSHKLFFTLVAQSFSNNKIKDQLGKIILSENQSLSRNLSNVWDQSPIKGISLETWGIFFNAIVDELALQALLQKDFPVEKTYEELEQLLNKLSHLINKEEK